MSCSTTNAEANTTQKPATTKLPSSEFVAVMVMICFTILIYAS